MTPDREKFEEWWKPFYEFWIGKPTARETDTAWECYRKGFQDGAAPSPNEQPLVLDLRGVDRHWRLGPYSADVRYPMIKMEDILAAIRTQLPNVEVRTE